MNSEMSADEVPLAATHILMQGSNSSCTGLPAVDSWLISTNDVVAGDAALEGWL
ncbi:hypothetical protein ACT009_16880 [Sphingomonas sp. Tas61C01]|uniref:hypothetical protein n=1 Tax=Sphingomonas sp. Tas61C01 TaxID=3458297 RepID=UPI00403E48B9